VQAQTALLARLIGRPVRIELTREESVRMHPKRHPMTMDYTVGCDAEGRLTAARVYVLGDSGAYASVGGKVLERVQPYRDKVALHERNIEAIQKEIARLQ
jgi:xanthine dehydrogenase molybdenum-binding subunit